MPQLYENQIQAKASQNTYGKAPQIKNYVGEALENVAALSDTVSKELAAQEDAQLKATVDARTREALTFMEEADPESFDYTEASTKAADIYNSAFAGFNDAAVSRYNRMNPEHSAMMDLALNKMALQKTREKAIAQIDSDISKYASETVLGYSSEADFDKVLDAYPLKSEQRTALKDKYKHDVDMGRVQFAIAGHEWKTAIDLINATEKTNTLSAEERYRLAQSVETASHEAARRIKEKKDNFQELQVDVLLNHVKELQFSGHNAAAAELIDKIANGEEVVVEYGGIKVNTKDIAPLAKDSAITKMRGFDQKGSQAIMTKASATRRGQDLIANGENIYKNGTAEDKIRFANDVEAFRTASGGYIKDMSDDEIRKLEFLTKGFETSLLENTISARDMVVYKTYGGLKSTAAPAPGVDLSLVTGGLVGAISAEEMAKEKEKLMSGGNLTGALSMVASRLEEKVLTGNLKPNANTVGKYAEYLYASMATASPAALSKMGLTGMTPERAARAYRKVLGAFESNMDIYNQETDSEEGYKSTEDVYNAFVTSALGAIPEQTEEQKHAVFSLKSNVINAARGLQALSSERGEIPYYSPSRGMSSDRYFRSYIPGLWTSKKYSNVIREADVAYPETATQNFLKKK